MHVDAIETTKTELCGVRECHRLGKYQQCVQTWPEDRKKETTQEIILEDNTKTDLRGMGVDSLDLMIHASYDRVR
jgi:hypothetical protein